MYHVCVVSTWNTAMYISDDVYCVLRERPISGFSRYMYRGYYYSREKSRRAYIPSLLLKKKKRNKEKVECKRKKKKSKFMWQSWLTFASTNDATCSAGCEQKETFEEKKRKKVALGIS